MAQVEDPPTLAATMMAPNTVHNIRSLKVLHGGFYMVSGVVLAAEEAYFGSGARTGSVLPSTWFTGTSSSPYQNTTGRNKPSFVRLM